MKSMTELEQEMKFFNKGRDNLIMMIKNKNFFERLTIPLDADSKILKNKYRVITLRWHPDMINKQGPIFGNKSRYSTFMSEVFMLYKEAYQILSDDKERKKYVSLLGRVPNALFKHGR